jgi:3',5'-cyclic AMP phosphodiesterase CpdA
MTAAPDVVLVTGDLTDHGTAEEYAAFRDLIAPLPMPVYVIPGNHDDRARMLQLWPAQGVQHMERFMQYTVESHAVRLIALDTVRPGSDRGEIDAERLAWLDARLAEAPARPTLVFMHHPPFRSGMQVLDALDLEGAGALAAVLARHPQVERVVAGHIHCEMQARVGGTLAMTASSTGLQIKVELGAPERVWATPHRPTCLVHAWSASHGLRSWSSAIGAPGPYPLIHDGTAWLG